MVFDFVFGSSFSMDLLRNRALRRYWSHGLLLWAAADVTIKLKKCDGFNAKLMELLMNTWVTLTKT